MGAGLIAMPYLTEALMGTAIVGGIGKAALGFTAADQQRRALDAQIVQQKLSYEKNQLNADSQMQQFTSTQIAKSSASGFTYSGSMANITASNMDKFAQDSEMSKLQSDQQVAQLTAQKDDVYRNAWVNAFSTGIETVSGFGGSRNEANLASILEDL